MSTPLSFLTTSSANHLLVGASCSVVAGDLRLCGCITCDLRLCPRSLLGTRGGPLTLTIRADSLWVEWIRLHCSIRNVLCEQTWTHLINHTTLRLLTTNAYPTSSGTMEHVDLQLLDSPSDSTAAIQRSRYFKVSRLTSQYATLRCDYIVITSQGPPSLYLRFPIPNYATTYLLNGLMKRGELIQNSQIIGLMKRSRCEWDWTLS